MCGQLGETVTGGGLLPSTCKSVGCQRATVLASTSCAAAFARKPQLDPLVRTCQAAAAALLTQPPQRCAITDPGGSIASASAIGAAITDGMGAGGHNSSGSGHNTVTVQAAPGQVAAVTLEALWLPAAD